MQIQLNAVLKLLIISSLAILSACSRSNDSAIPAAAEETIVKQCDTLYFDPEINPLFDPATDDPSEANDFDLEPLAQLGFRATSKDRAIAGLALEPFYDPDEFAYQVNLNRNVGYVEVFTSHAATSPAGPIRDISVTLTVESSNGQVSETLSPNVWSSAFYIGDTATEMLIQVNANLNLADVYVDCEPSAQQLLDSQSLSRTYRVLLNRDSENTLSIVGNAALTEGRSDLAVLLGEDALNSTALDAEDRWGHSVAIYGDILVVGVPGDDNGDNAYFGVTVVTDDNRAGEVDGLNPDDTLTDSGAAFVYERVASGDWRLTHMIKAEYPGAGDRFGHSVAIDGDLIAISAPYEDSAATTVDGVENNNQAPDSGAVYVYRRVSEEFEREAYIKPPTSQTGNVGFYAGFGDSVLLNDDFLFVTSPDKDLPDQGIDVGSVETFVFDDDDGWQYAVAITSGLARAGDNFGKSISSEGGRLLIGAPGDDSIFKQVLNSDGLAELAGVVGDDSFFTNTNSGAAHFFERANVSWAQTAYLKAQNADKNDAFGQSVDLGWYIVVGAPGEDGSSAEFNQNMDSNSLSNSGAAYVYYLSSNRIAPGAYIKSSAPQAGAEFGKKISGDTGTLLISAPSELVADDSAKGKVYVLEGPGNDGLFFKDVRWAVDDSSLLTEAAGAALDISNGKIAIGVPGFVAPTDQRSNAGNVLVVE